MSCAVGEDREREDKRCCRWSWHRNVGEKMIDIREMDNFSAFLVAIILIFNNNS